MRSNYIHFASPQFRLLSDKQIEELHFATMQILERTGVVFESQAALDLLGEAGADITNPDRVKIPSYLVEQALRTAPKIITIYTRDGEPAIVLNGMSGSHFRGLVDCPEYLDPYSRQKRKCYVEDVADMVRVIDSLPNIELLMIGGAHPTVPGTIADKVSFLQVILNTSKPLACSSTDVSSLKEMLRVCALIAGGEKELQARPFLMGTSQPVSPLMQGKDALEKSLLCAENGIPNFVYGMPMAGATTAATFPAVLATAAAEVLSQLVVIQLKKPGAPVIFGSMPNIMDMRTMIYPYGAPELSLLVTALTELCHYYRLPMLGSAGYTDAEEIDAQAGAEVTYQIMLALLSGVEFAHDVGVMYHAQMVSPEFTVFADEIIDMVNVSMGGIEINEETLPLDLIDRIGPRGTYISEKHTLKHFRKFWVPTIFDRSMVKDKNTKRCHDLLNEKTLEILKNHQPKPLPEDIAKEIKKIEASWLNRVGLKEYPGRPSS